jgi:hypothetical protein
VRYAFLVTIADEGAPQLAACLASVRAAYPDAPLVVISDGVYDPDYPVLCAQQRARYVPDEFLKRIECGGAWWERLLTLGLQTGADYLVKIDPDTLVHRPFQGDPPGAISGTMQRHASGRQMVQGGCQVIAAAAARRLLDPALIGAPELAERKLYVWDGPADDRRIDALSYLSTDKSLLHLSQRAKLALADWDEVGSEWGAPAPTGDYAVTHPHRLPYCGAAYYGPLRVITTCKGRLAHLKETLPTWLEPGVAVTVVDYDCPDHTADWVQQSHPDVDVVRLTGEPRFNLSRGRNCGARYAPAGWWCFFDADWKCAPGWAAALRAVLRDRHYYLVSPIGWDQFGSVTVHSQDYRAVGGYDERFCTWGSEDGDFYARLRQLGTRPDSMPGRFFATLPHERATRSQFYAVKDIAVSHRFNRGYYRLKQRFMLECHRLPTEAECDALFRANQEEQSVYDSAYVTDPPGAVAFTPGGVAAARAELAAGAPQRSARGCGGCAPVINVSVTIQNVGQEHCAQTQPATGGQPPTA